MNWRFELLDYTHKVLSEVCRADIALDIYLCHAE